MGAGRGLKRKKTALATPDEEVDTKAGQKHKGSGANCGGDVGEEEEEREKDEEVTLEDSAPASYLYGYDTEHKQAWRIAPPSGFKEFADKLVIPENASDSDATLAFFHDGDTARIVCMTVKDLRIEQSLRVDIGGRLWQGSRDGQELYIQRRKDRSPLLGLYKKKDSSGKMRHDKMLCMIHLKHFGNPQDEVVLFLCLGRHESSGQPEIRTGMDVSRLCAESFSPGGHPLRTRKCGGTRILVEP